MRKIAIITLLFLSAFSFAQTSKKAFTLEDIFTNRKFSSRGGFGFQSMKDGEHYVQVKKDSLNLYDYVTGKLTRTLLMAGKLIPAGDTAPIDISSFEFSPNESRILFANDVEAIYRYSSKASYYVYDFKTGSLSSLSGNGKQRLAAFSPDGNRIAFVRDNNLFVSDLSETGKPTSEKQITLDGKMNEIINGATDWVYEEEFGFTSAFFWSPDSKKIAFYRFDESKVKEFQLTYYGDLYPEQYKYKYPKAGEDNSVVSLLIYDLSSSGLKKVETGDSTDIYIPRVKWTKDPALLSYYRMNRHQNKLELMIADAATGASHAIYTEENKYYIEINDHLHFLDQSKGFLLSSEKDGYNHIYLYDMTGKPIRQITSGKWEVTDIKGVDEKNDRIFYVSTESSPLDRDLYSISLDGKNKKKLSAKKGVNAAEFNSTFSYYVNRQSDLNTPPYITLNKVNGEVVRVIQDNAKLKETLAGYQVGQSEFFTFKTADRVELNGWILKPASFDPAKKYPVLFCIYGGPGSQTVLNAWGMVSMWQQYLAQKGIIVVSVDNRGTGGRGEEFKKLTYLQLGKYETSDQIEAAQYLGTLSFVDKDRIGMWGWSFGGYMTLSCLTKGADYFSLGVAVAPVTNWKYYDNIYTERFMRTPKENPDGYESNSPINHTEKMKGKLLLVHGLADDNVHVQNSMDFITSMVASGKQFEMQLYPNSNHGIYTGKNTTFHLYQRMTNFILDGFGR